MSHFQQVTENKYRDWARCPACRHEWAMLRFKRSAGREVNTFCPKCKVTSIIMAGHLSENECRRCGVLLSELLPQYRRFAWAHYADGTWGCGQCWSHCLECGKEFVRTSEWWKVCPDGHGGLVPAGGSDPKARREEREFLRRAKKVIGELEAKDGKR